MSFHTNSSLLFHSSPNTVAAGMLALVERDDSHGVALVTSKDGLRKAVLNVEETPW